jgi:hypothetical protein
MTMHALLKKLQGGGRRSIGKVQEVVEDVRNDFSLFEVLVDGLFAEDPLIRMRAADALEKITADFPEYLQPFKSRLIRLTGETTQQEVKWHLAQILPRLELKSDEKKEIVKKLFLYLNDKSKIVVTFALQALADLAVEDKNLQPRIIRVLEEFTQTGSPAIKSRGRKLLKQLKGIN